jgi:hypothetical protein
MKRTTEWENAMNETALPNDPTILVHEPDEELREYYRSFFTQRGFHVTFEDGPCDILLTANPHDEFTDYIRKIVASDSPEILCPAVREDNTTLAITKKFHMEELGEMVEVALTGSSFVMYPQHTKLKGIGLWQ